MSETDGVEFTGQEVAVVGMAGRFPGARDVAEFWRNLREGVCSISRFTEEELIAAGQPPALVRTPGYVGAQGVLQDVELFDAGFFGLSPRDAVYLNPSQRVFLETAWEALESAGYDPAAYAGRVGVFTGAELNGYYKLISRHPKLRQGGLQLHLGNAPFAVATRTSFLLNLEGPSLNVQTACSSSLVAVHLAVQSLLAGESDMALAGGVSVHVPQVQGYVWERGGISSPDGLCRSYDAEAGGAVPGSGVGIVVLKRLEDALADGDTVHAVIRGTAINNDGAGKIGYTAPRREGQARAIGEALAMAGVEPDEVSYVEGHGSATELGDPIEVEALTQAFRARTQRTSFCALGSVKSNVGHLDAAAGVTGLIKTVLALENGELPPSVNFRSPNPKIDFARSPFYVNAELRPWPRGGTPRRAGVSSFGMGGTNAHAVLEEAPRMDPSGPSRPLQLLVLSARSAAALEAATDRLARHLREHPEQPLADVAHTLRVGRRRFTHRRTLVCGTREEAVAALEARDPARIRGAAEDWDGREAVFLFPGLGDHYAQMARGLYEAEPVFREEVDRCAALLRPHLGRDVREVLFPGEAPPEQRAGGAAAAADTDLRRMLGRDAAPAGELGRTELAHPAVFVVEYALARLWTAWGVAPAAMLGHSLGEYVAATLAGVFELPDALALVAERARLIAELPEGAMLAVPLDPAGVESLLGGGIALAAHNAPGLCTLAGPVDAVAALEVRLVAEGVACRRLNAGHAFHSPLMQPVAERLAERVRRTPLRAPTLPFLSNVTGTWITAAEATDPEYWTRHLCRTVRFGDCLRTLLEEPGRLLVEVGPGRTLGTFALAAGAPESSLLASLRHAYTRQSDLAFLLESLGRSWLAGARVDWGAFAGGERRRRVPLPTYPWERQRYWVEIPARSPRKEPARRRPAEDGPLLLAPAWNAAPLPEPAGGARGWVLFADALGIGAGLAEGLRAEGHRVVEVEPGAAWERVDADRFRLRPERGEDYGALVEALRAGGFAPAEWVHLWSLAGPEGESVARTHRAGYAPLLHLARALEHAEGDRRVQVVCDGVFDATGVDRVAPAAALLLGPLAAIPREFPGLACRVVDVRLAAGGADRPRLLETLGAELRGGSEAAVALRGWRRWARAERPVRDAEPAAVRGDGFYLLGGRPGPRGLAAAAHLASAGARLLLLERESFPEDRGAWDRWLLQHDRHHPAALTIGRVRALEAAGVEVRVRAVDARDPARVAEAVAEARERFGPLRGVLHGLDLARARESVPLRTLHPGPEEEDFRAALEELEALERALAGESPDFCLLQTVVPAAETGSLRAHREALGAMAAALARRHGAEHRAGWTAVAWEHAPELDDPAAAPPVDGEWTALLERVLALRARPEVRVARRRRERAARPGEPAAQAGSADATQLYSRPALATPYAAPATDAERRVAEVWQETLGIGQVGIHDDFFSLGGHSLFATQIISRLRDAFRVELSLGSLFETPTVAGLSRRVDELQRTMPAVEVEPIVPVPHDGPLPLSFQQLRMWMLDQMEPGNPFYNVATAFPFRGRLDTAAARRALEVVVDRHAVLRTVYRAEGAGEPVQVILPRVEVPFPVTDLRRIAGRAEREAEAWRLSLVESGRPFDLAEGSFRVGLVRVADDEYVLLTTVHHIATDGWSSGIFFEEWVRAYAALAAGGEPRLPPLPVQYADFAVWQRNWLTGETLEAQVSYWKERLAGAPLALELPTDRVRPPLRSYRGGQYRLNVSPELKERLEALCAREGVTLFILLMAAFKVLLRRYSGQDDLVVGTVDANRARPETEPLLGFFINTLPIRTRLDGDPAFTELLARVRDASLGAYAHAELPLEKLLEELQLERDLSRNPLIQVMFGFERPIPHFSDPNPDLALRRVEHEERGLTESGTAKFDLDFLLREHPEDATFSGSVGYNADLFDAATAERLMVNYIAVLEAVAAGPERRVSELEVMSPRERERVLAELNDTARTFPALPLAHELFAEAARRTPDAPAVLWGAERMAYAELDARAARLARALRRRGVGPEVPVGVCLERGPGMMAALLGVLGAGGAFVPLDPAHPDDRIAHVLRDSGVALVVAEERLRDRLAGHGAELLVLDGGEVEAESAEPVDCGVRPENLAYVIYTSGSTGTPKGVRVEHRSLLDTLLGAAERFGVRAGDVMPSLASFAFDIWLFETLLPLAHGGAVRMVPAEHVTDMDALLREAEDATLLHAVPALMRQLVGALSAAGRTPPGLRRAFVGGDAVPPDLLAEMRAAFPAAEVNVLYGPTEAAIICTAHAVRESGLDRSLLGAPLPNACVYVCDAEGLPLPLGVPGELLVGGPGLARGYHGRPDLTAERFVPDALSGASGGRLYRTGDRARWRDDGTLEFLGRTDEQVKVRGYRIEPGEIEAALLRHPGVSGAVVVVREDAPGDRRLVGYFTSADGVSAPELRAHLRGGLPEYMIPAALVPLDAFPLTPTGKTDRGALPAPDPAAAETEYVAPSGPVEETLAEVWREVLRVERVGVHDNFFALGGDSILSIQAVARARRSGVELSPRHFFEHPTIAELAPLVGRSGNGAHAPGTDGRRAAPFALAGLDPEALDALRAGAGGEVEDAYPLTPMQEGMLFHSLYAPGEGGYVGQYVFSLAGEVDVEAFRRAWQGAVDRHAALRTGFAWQGMERPLQVVLRRAEMPFRVEDWRGVADAEQATRLDEFVAGDRAAGFEPARAPLMRMALFRQADDLYRAVWTHHHLATDGWSLPLVFRDVVALYDAYARGAEIDLGGAPSYRDYVAWLQGRDLAGAERFWREALAGFAAPTPLEFARPAPSDDATGYGRARMELPEAEAGALQALARRHQLTLNTLVQGAWALLLARYGGGEDVLFGAVVSGRPGELEGVEEMVGLFINTVPVRVRTGTDQRLPEWLAGLQRQLATAREHAYTPLVQIRSWTDVPASQPLFESILVFQNQPMEDVLAGGERRLAVRDWEGTEQADLPLTLVAAFRDRLLVEAEFQRARFSAEGIERMLGHLRTLLEEMAADPERTPGDVGLLSGEERRQVLEAWSGTREELPALPVHEAFAARVRERPGAVAVVSGGESLTYAELDARAGRLAGELRLRGAGPEARVAFYLERGVEPVVAMLATLEAGSAFVPLDPAYRSERVDHMLRDSGASVLVTTEALRDHLGAFGGETVLVDGQAPGENDVASVGDPAGIRTPHPPAPSPTRGEGENGTAQIGEWQEDAPPPERGRVAAPRPPGGGAPGADSLAYVVYTSGSTGTPKGVAVPHGALANAVAASVRLHGIDADTRLLQAYSFSFDPAVLDVFMALTTGAALHVAGREDQLSGERLAELLRSQEITAAALAPALLGSMPDADLPALRTVIAGGDVCPPETVARWSRGRRFFIAYGPTEATVVATALEVAGPDGGAPPIGRPLPNLRAFVVDAEGRAVPVSVPGELLVGGAGVARGYLGRPELTAERFVPDALSGEAGARLYRTGDRVRWRADGVLEFLGRVDQQVKVRGFRIEPGEIEAVLAAHPAVRDAVVVAREDASGERRLVAYVTPSGDDVPTDELRAHARERLPEHMVPSALVVLAELPLTPSGKTDRRALPAPEGGADAGAYVAPRTPAEELLADIVADVLALERVGVHDNFFDVGGHSLLATRVLARIRRAFGVDLPLRSFFAAPTVAGLAEHLSVEQPSAPEAEARLEAMLGRLEDLSDEEVMRLLGE